MLDTGARAELDRHAAACSVCAAELEARRIVWDSLARDAEDDERDRKAVEGATARLVAGEGAATALRTREEALDQVAVERAMSYLDAQKASRSRSRRFIRSATGFAALAAAAAAAILFAVSQESGTKPTTAATATVAASTRTLVLADGSEIAPDDDGTPVHVTEDTPLSGFVTTFGASSGSMPARSR
jgi:ferric-dicitrate binding protein FerR (iron transport regulator)